MESQNKVGIPGILLSHYVLRTDKELLELARLLSQYIPVLIDCGAYTDYNLWIKSIKKGKPYSLITVKDYTDVCKREYAQWAWGYMSLDELNNHKVTLSNYLEMLDLGSNPIPILHPGAPETNFSQMYKLSDGRVAVGGIAGIFSGKNKKILAYANYQKWYEMSGNKVKLHALGFMKYPEIKSLPIQYSDSTAFLNGFKFGVFAIFNPVSGFDQYSFRTGAKYNRADKQFLCRLSLMHACGATLKEIKDKDFYSGKRAFQGFATIYAYLQMAKYLYDARKFIYFFSGSGIGQLAHIFSTQFNSKTVGFDYHKTLEMSERLQKKDSLPLWKEMMQEYYS